MAAQFQQEEGQYVCVYVCMCVWCVRGLLNPITLKAATVTQHRPPVLVDPGFQTSEQANHAAKLT